MEVTDGGGVREKLMKETDEEHAIRFEEPNILADIWNQYVVLLRSYLSRLEAFFEVIGRMVATNPKKTILFAIFGVILCAVGLVNISFESRTSKLFVPENSLTEKALLLGKPFFLNSLNTRTEEIIVLPKNGSNILSEYNVKEALWLIGKTKNISGYKELCKERQLFLQEAKNLFDKDAKCSMMNPLELLQNKVESQSAIFWRFYYALRSTRRLMSNGRAAVFNVQYGLSNFKMNRSSRQVSADAIRVLIYMKQGESESERKPILKWEKSFIDTMQEVSKHLKYNKLSFSSERSLDDAISESSTSGIPLISMTFTIMITFSCFMLAKFINPVRGHTWLALLGVLSTGLGILAGIGFTSAMGFPFIGLIGIVPFLVLSIGIDDMFIICDEFDRQSKDNIPSNRVAFALSKVGATITMTTVTDMVAFFVSATSAFPALRYFCVFTAVCISIEFLLQISLFVAFLTFDSLRIYRNRSDCCPMMPVRDRTCFRLPNNFSFSSKWMQRYGERLLKTPAKIFVCILTLVLVGVGIFGCINVDNRFSRKALALKGSYYSNYLDEFTATFPQTIPVDIQITTKMDYSDPNVRKEIGKLASIAYDTGYYLSKNFTWVHYFEQFTTLFRIDANGPKFKKVLSNFLNQFIYSQHNVDVIMNDRGEINASRVIVFLKDKTDAVFRKDAMLKLRDALKKSSKLNVTVAADPFLFFEQYAVVQREIINNLILVSSVIMVMLVPFCIHPLIIFIILLGFIALVLELFGLMYLWDVQLNAISMINIVMAVGFSVDYSTHIAHAFVTSREDTVDKRIIEALSTVGGSVLLGGSSTFIGMSLTGFSSSTIFQTFFKMFFGIILFGLFNGLVFLPVALSMLSRFVEFNTKASLSPGFQITSLWKKLFGAMKKKKVEEKHGKSSVSIIGMSTRFPTASNKEEFWDLLREGVNTTTDYPEGRHARNKYFEDVYNPARPVSGKLYVSRGSYLENIEGFDHKFFGISATEAKSMDPQQRLLLQGTCEAIEDAGMKIEELQNCCTGVYVGIMNLDYSSIVLRDDTILSIDQFASTGTAFSIAANRISFSLNLTGPSVATDTACSSSLTALSIACDHLQRKVVDVAIVAAANLILCPRKQVTICRANMLAPDGKCKVFDEKADGYGRGEGIVVFVLKASDNVQSIVESYGDILSWGVNNDGQTAAPMTAPSVQGQTELMKNVLQQANVKPKDVQYVEMHGTGTIIGDLVETRSVGEVYGKSRSASDPLLIGSVKSNINHTESAAGLAGLAKLCLMFKHNHIASTVGIENQASRLSMGEKGLLVVTEGCTWPKVKDGRKLAALNSFGYGGSNAHLILQEPKKELPAETKIDVVESSKQKITNKKSSMMLLALSAKSQPALIESARSFSQWIQTLEDTPENQVNVCYTLNERRTDHSVRLTVAATSLNNASDSLNQFAEKRDSKVTSVSEGKIDRHCSKIAFVYGGQGSQWLGMAGDVLSHEDILQKVKRIDHIAKKRGHTRSLLAYLKGEKDPADEDGSECLVTVQLSIFALQCAVTDVLTKNASILPTAVGGHSLGDITAAHVAGIIKLKEAVKIIMARASLQEQCESKGAMAAIGLPIKEVKAIFEKLKVCDRLCIAAENDKNSVTISGDEEAIDEVEKHVEANRRDVFWRRLTTHKAFHSHHMEGIKHQFMKQLDKAKLKPKLSQTKFISTTVGKKIYGTEINDEYWWKNLRNTVLFNPCINVMFEEGVRIVIEISPRPVLMHYINAISKQAESEEITILQALPSRKEENRLQHLYAQCIGKMYTLGYPVSFNMLQDQSNGNFIRYPTYSWQETDLWAKDDYNVPQKTLPLLGVPVSVNSKSAQWENEIDLHQFEFLGDHRMKAAGVILPGACYIEMALEAALVGTNIEPVMVKNVMFQNILPLHENLVRKVKCEKRQSDFEGIHDFRVIHETEQGDVAISQAKLISFRGMTKGYSVALSQAMLPQEPLVQTITFRDDQKEMKLALSYDIAEDKENSSKEASDSGKSSYERDANSFSSKANSHRGSGSHGETSSKSNSESNIPLRSSSHSSTSSLDGTASKKCNREERVSFLKALALAEDEIVLRAVGIPDDSKQITRSEFKELTANTGFQFGERFSLIEHAWSTENKALVRLSIPLSIEKEMHNYIVHPCIIDACLQSCIALGATDHDRQVIPIGVNTVRMNPIVKQFRYLYGYAEVSTDAPDTCDVKLLDDKGNVIMYLQGFTVKEISRTQRYPSFETSTYEMNWIVDGPEEMEQKKTKSVKENIEFLIVGLKDTKFHINVKDAISALTVHEGKIHFQEIAASDTVTNFTAKVRDCIEDYDLKEKQVVVVNLLASIAHSIAFDMQLSLSAHWLCFESTLELLKILSDLNMQKSKLVVFTRQSFGYEAFDKQEYSVPWAATALGLARVTNLETNIPVICIDVRHDAEKEDFEKAFASIDLPSTEEGLIVSDAGIQQPLFERVNTELVPASQESTLKANQNFYLSFSASEDTCCLKQSPIERLQLPEGFVEIRVSHVSSPVGQCKALLKNIQSADSDNMIQSVAGTIIGVNDNVSGLQCGENVIAVFNSKWIKDKVRLPVNRVFRKPPFLQLDQAVLFPPCLALAHNILARIAAVRKGINKIFVAPTNSNRSLCWAISFVAKAKGLDVTFDETTGPNDCQLVKGGKLTDISEKHMKGTSPAGSEYDCIVCSSELHPVDNAALINAVRKDGVIAIIDNENVQTLRHYNVTSSITMLYIKPLVAQLSTEEISNAMDATIQATNQNILKHLPDVKSLEIADVCHNSNEEKLFDQLLDFCCVKMSTKEEDSLRLYAASMDIQGLKEDRTYIVIGGTKGLGLNTVKWMASRGAGTIITVGRSSVPEDSLADFGKLEEQHGVNIIHVKADAGTLEGIAVLEEQLNKCEKIGGIINSAAVLDDKLFKDVDRENYRKVFGPKITATLLLHDMLEKRNEEIDFFVLYSSITSVLGNSGQTTYSAANAFMNSFADYRKKVLGKPCLAVCWGAMGGAGILERNNKVAMLLEKSGLHLLDIPNGLTWMDKVLTTMPHKSNICICDIDWRKFLKSLPSKKANSIIFDAIRREIPESEDSSGEKLLDMILRERSKERQREILLTFIVRWIAAWISGTAEEVDTNVPLFTYGIDSVGASAFKSQIEKDLQIDLEVFFFMQPDTTANKLAETLLEAIHEKFIKKKTDETEEEDDDHDEDAKNENDPLLEKEEEEDKLVLPKDYLSVVYSPPDPKANFFIVHPSHRYAGVFQALGAGMKYQNLFSLYAFGSQDPSYLGEDIGSVTRLAKSCVAMILDQQPHGPYFLGGYSFGGLVALEIATILQNMEKEVALVVMIDTSRWLPEGRNNAQLLIDMFDTSQIGEELVQEQMKNFFARIATMQLKMRLQEFFDIAEKSTFKELEEVLTDRAKSMSVAIPDIQKILESTSIDQEMSSRCHDAWLPPANIYDGQVLYIQADDDRFCRAIVGIGNSADCWANVLQTNITVITCSGDHFSMMDPSRAPDIGSILTLSASLIYRSLLPNLGRIPKNACHKASLQLFRQHGLKVSFIGKRFGRQFVLQGKLKVNKSEKKLKFIEESAKLPKRKLILSDVVNIAKIDIFSSDKEKSIKKMLRMNSYGGFSFRTKDGKYFKIIVDNRQDHRRFVSLLEAVYSLNIPL